MFIINDLTPDIKGKAFSIDWFLLRQRFETKLFELSEELQKEKDTNIFAAAFADKLKEFGTIDRLIEVYSAAKMELRKAKDVLRVAHKYMGLNSNEEHSATDWDEYRKCLADCQELLK